MVSKSRLRALVIVIAACAAVAVPAGAAGAQPRALGAPNAGRHSCGGYPPQVQIEGNLKVKGGHFDPGGSGWLDVSGATIGGTYTGSINPPPIAIGPEQPDIHGILHFTFDVPSDFELGATHNVYLCRGGALVMNRDFCVNGGGNVAGADACRNGPNNDVKVKGEQASRAAGSDLGHRQARTGQMILNVLRVAAILGSVGAILLLWRRRRLSST